MSDHLQRVLDQKRTTFSETRAIQPSGDPTLPAGSCPTCRKPVVWIVDNAKNLTEACEHDPVTFMTVTGRKLKGYSIHVCKPGSPS